MEYVMFFLVDGVLGYFLQAFGYVMSLYAFTKKEFDFKYVFFITFISSILMFLIRQISVISFGYHTVLIMVSFILMAVLLLKTQTFLSVISVLTTTLAILLCEALNLTTLHIILGQDKVMYILQNDATIFDRIYKSLLGAPTNIVLVIIMLIIYIIRMKKKKKKVIINGNVK